MYTKTFNFRNQKRASIYIENSTKYVKKGKNGMVEKLGILHVTDIYLSGHVLVLSCPEL